jgi:hypothetical protein
MCLCWRLESAVDRQNWARIHYPSCRPLPRGYNVISLRHLAQRPCGPVDAFNPWRPEHWPKINRASCGASWVGVWHLGKRPAGGSMGTAVTFLRGKASGGDLRAGGSATGRARGDELGLHHVLAIPPPAATAPLTLRPTAVQQQRTGGLAYSRPLAAQPFFLFEPFAASTIP